MPWHHWLGTDSGNSAFYLFYSGRVGHLPVDGTPFVVCHRHHPDPPAKETITKRYHLYLGGKPGRG